MSSLVDVKVVVIVPNWNGLDSLAECLDSLQQQSLKTHVIVVDNGSVDGSTEVVENKYPRTELIKHNTNKGYAGGVNAGFRRAVELGAKYAAPFNNDAVADKDWLKQLVEHFEANPKTGIAACKLLNAGGSKIDSTGDYYTNWGLPYPRGRGELDINKYDDKTEIFGASGGASLYRVEMLKEIGLFDEYFFAYYEDVDLSFRAQLAGWKVAYVPSAIVYHQIGATSSRIKGFTTYQTLKNLPAVLWKNVPWRHMPHIWPRLVLAWYLFAFRALSRGQVWPVVKATVVSAGSWPSMLLKRRRIQKNKKVTDEYIWDMLVHDLPPNAKALRRLRAAWWKLRGKKA